jgi:hypothetical protein
VAFSLYISRKLTIQYCFCLSVRSVSDLSRFLSRRVLPLVLASTTTRTSLISCIPSRRFPYFLASVFLASDFLASYFSRCAHLALALPNSKYAARDTSHCNILICLHYSPSLRLLKQSKDFVCNRQKLCKLLCFYFPFLILEISCLFGDSDRSYLFIFDSRVIIIIIIILFIS